MYSYVKLHAAATKGNIHFEFVFYTLLTKGPKLYVWGTQNDIVQV